MSPPSRPSAGDVDAVRVIALALAISGAREGGGHVDAAPFFDFDASVVDAAREALAEWAEKVGAPPFEVRRAGRRLSVVSDRLDELAVSAALELAEPWAAARLLVDECARLDRDFGWDVPLRDVARALIQAALRAL